MFVNVDLKHLLLYWSFYLTDCLIVRVFIIYKNTLKSFNAPQILLNFI